MQRLWFKAKRYGWGWTPATWEGWVVLGVYVLLLALIFKRVDQGSHSVSDTLFGVMMPAFFLTAVLLGVCWKTGEKPRWRWGK